MPTLYDAHNHLHDAWLAPDRVSIFANLAAQGVRAMMVNGTCESDWPEVAALCSEGTPHAAFPPSDAQPRLPIVLPSYGLHPWHVGNRSPDWQRTLLSALGLERSGLSPPDAQRSALNPQPASPRPFARVGEFGLDRWMLDRARPDDSRLAGLRRAPMAEQLEAFTWQFALATSLNRPATVHCLDAWGTLAGALRETPAPTRGFLLHAYGGSAALAREFAAHGAYFSFNGSFLGERQNAKREAFKLLPADRILVETDAPAMPLPASRRTHELPDTADGNTVNHPANIGAAYSGLAEIRGVSVDALAAQVERNFAALFL